MEGNKSQLVEATFYWSFPQYVHYPKGKNWYIISLVILTVAVILSVIFEDVLFAVFLILLYLVLLLQESKTPEEIEFAITPLGVKMGTNFKYYREIHHFFIIYKDFGIKNLYLEFKNPLIGRVVIPLDGQDAVAIREYLLKFVPEDLEREAEPLTEIIRRWIRF